MVVTALLSASQVRIIESGTGAGRYVDCVSIRGGKLEALERVRTLFGVPRDRCCAAGDSGNDILMLEGARHDVPYHPHYIMTLYILEQKAFMGRGTPSCGPTHPGTQQPYNSDPWAEFERLPRGLGQAGGHGEWATAAYTGTATFSLGAVVDRTRWKGLRGGAEPPALARTCLSGWVA